MNQYKYSQQLSESKKIGGGNNELNQKNLQGKLQKIKNVKDIKVKNKLLRGLIQQLKEENQHQMDKRKEKQNQQKIIVIHKKSLSQSTNFSFDNMKSISQVNSVVQEKKKQEILTNMIENYQKQIQDKEYMLIALKKQRYHIVDEIEDAIEDLQQTKIIEKYMQNELLAKENTIRFYFDEITNLKKYTKPITSRISHKSQTAQINKSNQSIQLENHGYTLNIFKGLFGSSIRNQSVFDEHFDKLSTRTVVQRNTTSSGEQ